MTTSKSQPTRASRTGDSQPLPTTDTLSEPVTPALQREFVKHAEFTGITQADIKHDAEIAKRICDDLAKRTELGIQRYGRPLETWNGRNSTLDAYEECLDAAQLLMQRVLEYPSNGIYKRQLWFAMKLVTELCEQLDIQ